MLFSKQWHGSLKVINVLHALKDSDSIKTKIRIGDLKKVKLLRFI